MTNTLTPGTTVLINNPASAFDNMLGVVIGNREHYYSVLVEVVDKGEIGFRPEELVTE